MTNLLFGVDIIIIVVYVIFNMLLLKKDKIKLNIWKEIMLRVLMPVIISILVWFFTGNLIIFALIFIGLIFVYLFNYSEWTLFTTFSLRGRKLVVLNFHEEEPIDNKINVYVDSSQKEINISEMIEKNLQKKHNSELEQYKEIIEGMKSFNLRLLYVNWCDIIKKGMDDYKFTHYLKIYYVNQHIDKELIPKNLNLNCVCLNSELVKDRQYDVILGIEGIRDEELLQYLIRFKYIFENVKVLPKYFQLELLQDELDAKNAVIEDLRTKLRKMKDFKGTINTELEDYDV